jgi:CheY-like chemotaxis protein
MKIENYTIRVLLAEDKEYMQELIKKYVLSNPNRLINGVNINYEIDIKSTAEDAILKYVSLEHDIVIMDLFFDGGILTGIDATNELLQVAPDLSIIGIASETDGKIEEFNRSGIRYFLEKPFQDGYLWSRMDAISQEIIERELAKPEPEIKKGLFGLKKKK